MLGFEMLVIGCGWYEFFFVGVEQVYFLFCFDLVDDGYGWLCGVNFVKVFRWQGENQYVVVVGGQLLV